MQVEQRWEVAGDVDSPGSETGRVWVATFREGGGQGGRDESDTGEEGCTDVKMIEVVDEMVRETTLVSWSMDQIGSNPQSIKMWELGRAQLCLATSCLTSPARIILWRRYPTSCGSIPTIVRVVLSIWLLYRQMKPSCL